MRILYQFPLSHFCEKARWLLDHKELDYTAQNLTPGLHRFMIHFRTGQRQLPVLRDKNTWVADSTKIAIYLDQHYPEHTLIRKEPELRERILKIDDLTQQLGIHMRRWLFYYILNGERSNAMDILIGEKGVLRDFEKWSIPMLKTAILKFHDINENSMRASKHIIDDLIIKFEAELQQNQSHDYMVGERFTLADISVCSMLAPLLMINGTPWEIDHRYELPIEILDFRAQIRQSMLGQYVQKIYENERYARVDWRGV